MRVGHDEDLELVLRPCDLGRVVADVPALLPHAAVHVVEGERVVDVGHADVALLRLGAGELVVGLKI